MRLLLIILSFSCNNSKMINNSEIIDCAGIKGGEAIIDECGVCTGGTTNFNYNYLMNSSGHCSGQGNSNKGMNEIIDYLLL